MDDLMKKISYLKGYADGVNIESEGNSGKIMVKIIEALDELADTVEQLSLQLDEVDTRLEDTEDIVDILSEEIIDEDDDYDDEDDDFEVFDEFDDEDDDESDFFEIECPNCHEDVMIDFDTIDECNTIVCPNCKESIELEFECDCDEDDCDCE